VENTPNHPNHENQGRSDTRPIDQRIGQKGLTNARNRLSEGRKKAWMPDFYLKNAPKPQKLIKIIIIFGQAYTLVILFLQSLYHRNGDSFRLRSQILTKPSIQQNTEPYIHLKEPPERAVFS
jgi:hypothetical protein